MSVHLSVRLPPPPRLLRGWPRPPRGWPLRSLGGGRTDRFPPVFYRTPSPPVPSGAAAQKGKNGHHHHLSGLPPFPLSLTNTQASSGYEQPFSSSRALILAQAQPGSSFCSRDIAEPWHDFMKKKAKMATTIADQVCRVSPSL